MTNSSLSDKRFKQAFASWWFAWAAIHYGVMLKFGVTQLEACIDSLVSNLLLAACCWLVSNNMRYYLPRLEKYWYVLVISLGLGCVWLLVIRIFLWLFFRHDAVYMALLIHSSTIRYGISVLIIGCMAAMSLLWYTQKEQKQIEERKTEAEKMTRDAELYKLRQQLQPHFLFNSLNSISALTGTQPEKARHMIQQLSDFLRGTLKKDEQQWDSLQDELQHLQLYLDIEKVRFGHRLLTSVDYDEEALQKMLPSMLLQPVVENAIKFGLYDTLGEVTITITAKMHDGALIITVTNPFDEATAQPLQGTGFGLASVQRRLFLLFARADLLHTRSENNHFITVIMIPPTQ